MNISIVCKGEPIVEIQDLRRSLIERGHAVTVIDPVLTLNELHHDGFWTPYLSADVLYYRTGLGDAARTELARRLPSSTSFVVNRCVIDNTLMSNKVYQALQVGREGIVCPTTLIGRGYRYSHVVEKVGTPFILKSANGIQGTKVFLVDNEQTYLSTIEQLSGDILMQRFIPNDGDYRVLVIGGEVVGMYQRIPKPGDFRANISQGGSGAPISDTALAGMLADIGRRVAKVLELDVVGVDIIRSKDTGEAFFIEANVNPGWKGLDAAIGTKTSQRMADWFETL